MYKEIIEKIKLEIEECTAKSGRHSDEVKLLAVTKTHPVEVIKASLDEGFEFIAENKVQEAEVKIPQLAGLYKEFHFIGHLQSNKINKLLSLNPDLIHSLDKLSTAEKLNKSLEKLNKKQAVLIEVNTSGEESKNGINPEDLSNFLEKIDLMDNIQVKGLMTIGALTNNEEEIRKCFRLLKSLFEEHKNKQYQNCEMKYLSMGMSNDFKIAISEGSNIIRLGSIIYGYRNYTK
jgi:hypothetical protein